MTTKEKIEQLIEKWKLKQEDLHNVWCPIDWYYIYVAEIIKDLQSLQDTTEERECENCKKLQKELDWISFSM